MCSAPVALQIKVLSKVPQTMFKMFRNETKTEKSEKKSKASTVTNTKMEGNFITTSVMQNQSKCYTSALHATTTTHIVQNPLVKGPDVPALIGTFNTNVDKLTFRGEPPRSAFTSTPLTTKPSPLNKRLSVDAKPFNVLAPAINRTATTTTTAFPSPVVQSGIYNTESNSATCASELRVRLKIKVKKSTKFYDDPNSKVPVYSTRSKHCRGKLLLINNINFVNGKDIRKGAELDEANTCELFKQLGFAIVKHTNLSKKEIESKVKKFAKDKTLSKVDIGVVIIMSHGTGKERSDSTEIACTDGERLPTTWIINEFDSDNCPSLNGKPKIFIFQCCRGNQVDIQYDSIPMLSRRLSDMLIAYATVPGFVAHRDPLQGTWYIQAICKVFMEHAHDTDVENLLKIVDNKLSALTDHGSKQTTSFENRGFKTCYLHPV